MTEVAPPPVDVVAAPAAATAAAPVKEKKLSKSQLREMSDAERLPYIQETLEKLLSKKNLCKDNYLRSCINPQMYVPTHILLTHATLVDLNVSEGLIIAAAEASSKLGVDATKKMIRPMLKSKRNTIIVRDFFHDPSVISEEIFATKPEFLEHIVSVKKDVNETYFVKFDSDEVTQQSALWLRNFEYKGEKIKCAIKSEYFLRSFFPVPAANVIGLDGSGAPMQPAALTIQPSASEDMLNLKNPPQATPNIGTGKARGGMGGMEATPSTAAFGGSHSMSNHNLMGAGGHLTTPSTYNMGPHGLLATPDSHSGSFVHSSSMSLAGPGAGGQPLLSPNPSQGPGVGAAAAGVHVEYKVKAQLNGGYWEPWGAAHRKPRTLDKVELIVAKKEEATAKAGEEKKEGDDIAKPKEAEEKKQGESAAAEADGETKEGEADAPKKAWQRWSTPERKAWNEKKWGSKTRWSTPERREWNARKWGVRATESNGAAAGAAAGAPKEGQSIYASFNAAPGQTPAAGAAGAGGAGAGGMSRNASGASSNGAGGAAAGGAPTASMAGMQQAYGMYPGAQMMYPGAQAYGMYPGAQMMYAYGAYPMAYGMHPGMQYQMPAAGKPGTVAGVPPGLKGSVPGKGKGKGKSKKDSSKSGDKEKDGEAKDRKEKKDKKSESKEDKGDAAPGDKAEGEKEKKADKKSKAKDEAAAPAAGA